MQIETFEVEEVNNEAAAMAADSEAKEIIERLNLSGQQALLNPETVTRNPYRVMTKEEEFVYRILCPQVTTVDAYSDAIIPLRVLQVYSHAKDTGFFKRFEVWAATSSAVKDPVLVGYTTIPGQQWGERMFILARWGSELEALEKLFTQAFKKFIAQRKSEYAKVLSQVQAAIASLDASKNDPFVPNDIGRIYVDLKFRD